MKYFGTVSSFDETRGEGSLTPETGGADLRFERNAFSWEPKSAPKTGERLSYELSHQNGQASAVNLGTI